MSGILNAPVKKRRLQYDRSNLPRDYTATLDGMSVCKAAKLYNVPESTLRDRTRGNVSLDAQNGHGTLLSHEEEAKLTEHIKYMASIGYGYTKSSVQFMAKGYLSSLGKTVGSSDKLSNNWFYGFKRRWPDLKTVKPQKLALSRAKSASQAVLSNYFKKLGTILTKYNLTNRPDRIFNIDETGVTTEHSPPKIVCDRKSSAQSVTSPRGSTTTIIAGGNAIGNSIPPYYVFSGVRWNEAFLSGALIGSNGTMSKSGWSSSDIFQEYLTKHFSLYAGIKRGNQEPTLILYDGHRSHISLTLTNWAKDHNVILFVLPPHTSHLTQPLDVGVFGPYKTMYYKECQVYMKDHPGISISKYDIAKLTNKPYLKSVTPENLTAAFRKTGIFPFNDTAFSDTQLAPAVIYPIQGEETSVDFDPNNTTAISEVQTPTNEPTDILATENRSNDHVEDTFFSKRTIKSVVISKKKRKFVPPFISGNLLKDSVSDILEEQASKKYCNEIKQSKKKVPEKVTSQLKKVSSQPVPSTSGASKRGGPIELFSPEDSLDSNSESEDEKCCVCNKFQPQEIKQCQSVIFVKWAKCDFCSHWTHLQFCTNVRVIRRPLSFFIKSNFYNHKCKYVNCCIFLKFKLAKTF